MDAIFESLNWKHFEFVATKLGGPEGPEPKDYVLRVFPLTENRECYFDIFVDVDSQSWRKSHLCNSLSQWPVSDGNYVIIWIIDAIASHLQHRISRYYRILSYEESHEPSRKKVAYEFPIWMITVKILTGLAGAKYDFYGAGDEGAKSIAKGLLHLHVDSYWKWVRTAEGNDEGFPIFRYPTVENRASDLRRLFQELGFADDYELNTSEVAHLIGQKRAAELDKKNSDWSPTTGTLPLDPESLKTELDSLANQAGIDFIDFDAPGLANGQEPGFVVARFKVIGKPKILFFLLDMNKGQWIFPWDEQFGRATGEFLSIENTGELIPWIFFRVGVEFGLYGHEDASAEASVDNLVANWFAIVWLQISILEKSLEVGLSVPEDQVLNMARESLQILSESWEEWVEAGLHEKIRDPEMFQAFMLLKSRFIELDLWNDEDLRPNQPPEVEVAFDHRSPKPTQPSETRVEPNPSKFGKRGLSTNAMAWIVALAVGAFIAIGAALGY